MEFTISKWQITSIEDPAIPQKFYLGDCFSIIVNCTEELIQITPRSNPNFSSTTTTANKTILVSSNIPCITARWILRRRRENYYSYMPEIVVNLHVTTLSTHIIVQDSDIYNDDAECAICLEKFGDGNEDSSVGVVRTNCSHVFHDRCMLRWFGRCANCQSRYSCPLCRCIIIPTSHSHDE
ncbi:hypothetical protein HN51_024264 [Arachis hypogaea]|nr:RING-H2 finger protein ATL79-like [Arachis hypogaea]